jgi:putative SOS response-associated peptidase YedK
MCYRYSIFSKPELLEAKWNAMLNQDFSPIYHASAFSQQKLPIITNDSPKEIILAEWGLIPHWVKSVKQADEIRIRTANARAETIYEKPSFRNAAKNKHCLVLADGFFEWREVHHKKYPYYVRLKTHEPFAMAGLWETWMNPDNGEEYVTYSIITTDANPLMAIVHNQKKRMPVILTDGFEKLWLSKDITKEQVHSILVPFEQGKMEAYTISKLITAKEKEPNVSQVLSPYTYPGVEPRFG